MKKTLIYSALLSAALGMNWVMADDASTPKVAETAAPVVVAPAQPVAADATSTTAPVAATTTDAATTQAATAPVAEKAADAATATAVTTTAPVAEKPADATATAAATTTTDKVAAPADAAVPAEVVAILNEKLKPLFGSAPDSLKETPVPGVYQAGFGMELIYVSKDGRYFFSGDMIDGQTRANLSESARSGARKAEMAKIDAQNAIVYKAKGDEKHVISVFTDVSCPYCSKLHTEVEKLNEKGVTVRYFAYPRAGIGSPAYKQMVAAWCSPDPKRALTDAKHGKTLEEKDCKNPVADDFALGQKLGVTGTPAIFTEDGTMIPGYRPANELVQALDDMKRTAQN